MFLEQFGLCHWCEKPMFLEREHNGNLPHDYATFDELMPRSRGGKRSRENQVLAHRLCNSQRGNTIATRKKVFPSFPVSDDQKQRMTEDAKQYLSKFYAVSIEFRHSVPDERNTGGGVPVLP